MIIVFLKNKKRTAKIEIAEYTFNKCKNILANQIIIALGFDVPLIIGNIRHANNIGPKKKLNRSKLKFFVKIIHYTHQERKLLILNSKE